MTGYITEQAGDANAGKWDIATVPGGGGNWGGSFLAVPTASKHQDLAVELVQFLTSAEGQMAAFKAVGNLPSNPHALRRQPSWRTATNDVLQRRPGRRSSSSPAPTNLEPVYLGAKNQPVRDAVENALRSVENGQRSSADGWADGGQATPRHAAG